MFEEDDIEEETTPGSFGERDRPDDVRGLSDTFSLREEPTVDHSEIAGLASLAADDAEEGPARTPHVIELPEMRFDTDMSGNPREETPTLSEETTESSQAPGLESSDSASPGLTLATDEEDRAAHPEDYALDGNWSDPVSDARERTQAVTRPEPTDSELTALDSLVSNPGATEAPQPEGLITPGNIDLHSRPIHHNEDGTYSTVRSMSIGTPEGEVLIPTIGPNGEDWSDEEARAHYDETGEHLGVFRSPEEATRYAEGLHEDQASEYGDRAGAEDGRQDSGDVGSTREDLASVEPDATTQPEGAESVGETNPELLGLEALRDKQDRERAEVAALPSDARLDAGLPSEEEIQHERDMDPFRRILHAIGAGLSGAGRGTVHPYEDRARDSRRERAQGLAQRLGLKAQDRTRQESSDQEAAQHAAQLALTRRGQEEANEDRDASRDITERSLGARVEHDRSVAGRAEASARREAELQRARSLPASPQSRSAQRILRAAVSQLPQSYQDTFNDQLPEGGIEGLNAIEAEGMLDQIPSISFRARPNGVGTGAGSARASGARDVLRDHLIETDHLDPEQAQREVDALDNDHVQARISAYQQGREGAATRESTPNLQQAAVAATGTSLGTLRSLVSQYGEHEDIPGIGIVDSRTPAALLSSEGQDIQRNILNLSDNYLRMTSGAAVPESEIRNFARRLGTWDERNFRRALEEIARETEARRTGQVQAPPETPAQTAARLGLPTLSGGRGSSSTSPPRGGRSSTPVGDTVRVQNAAGQVGTIRRSDMLPTDVEVQ
jgi:hypothetical protein